MVKLNVPKLEKWQLAYGKDVPSIIKNFRRDKGFSQRDLAKILKTKVQYISNIERDWYQAPRTFCNKVSKIMDWKRRSALNAALNIAILKKLNRH